MRATDADFGQSGRIGYSVQSDDWFRIERRVESLNPEVAVGVLKLNTDRLDRETSDRQCVYVLARDGFDERNPSDAYRETACQVCVDILDAKDTPPLFFNEGPLTGNYCIIISVIRG